MPATPVTQNHIKGLVESFDAPAIYKRRKVGESDATQVPRHTAAAAEPPERSPPILPCASRSSLPPRQPRLHCQPATHSDTHTHTHARE